MKWQEIVSTVAPVLGTAIGGPVGGIAVKAVTAALGLPSNASDKDLDRALHDATPEQLVALKKVEAEFEVQMRELDVDITRIHQADRDSARKRQAAIKDRIPGVLAVLTMISFFSYIGGVTFWSHAVMADPGFLNLAIGWLGGTASTVIAYYFGSSAGQDRMQGTDSKP
tara:strand:- start:2517 stop:3023 length:507 start_codon:yes stop_codon:yes gene_type:complete